jgi:hypothetical protein
MFPDYRAGAERGNRFAMDGRNSLVSFILGTGDRETFLAHFGKGNHRHFHVPVPEFFFPIAQLRDVPTARQSTQVAVKHHQKPLSPVILQPKDPPPGV